LWHRSLSLFQTSFPNVIAEVLNSYSLTLDYLRRLIDDAPDDVLATQPAGVVNHPLWTIGHLVFSAQMIGGEVGLASWLPDDWASRYGTGSIPVADRREYPSSELLLGQLSDAEHRLGERLRALGDEAMQQPLPDIRYREMFPTIGHAIAHVLAAHTAAHIGQTIVWRRAMGFGPMPKPFD
jgi:hypothetical protein